MSSSDSSLDISKFANSENIIEITKIDKQYAAIQFSESTGLIAIDLSKNSAAGKTFSNIHIVKMKNRRFLILADAGKVYSAAQIKDYISKNKHKMTSLEILNHYGINSKEYLFHAISNSSEPILVFRSQKLVSVHKVKIKIDCPNYVIISES